MTAPGARRMAGLTCSLGNPSAFHSCTGSACMRHALRAVRMDPATCFCPASLPHQYSFQAWKRAQHSAEDSSMLPQTLSAWRAASELSCGSVYSMLMSHQCGPEHKFQLVERACACAHCLAADIALLTHLFLDALTWTISAAKVDLWEISALHLVLRTVIVSSRMHRILQNFEFDVAVSGILVLTGT